MDKEYIRAKLQNLPNEPGSYQMKDIHGEIIYVGKAKNLHNRVNQYFVGAHDFKTTKMVSHIEDFDFIVTRTEKEALVLEINLIKKYRPKYNIMFIDDSSYPYIKLTRETYPRLLIARDMKKDRKSKYFGPFPDAAAARETLKILQTLYPFRRCTRMPQKVCLYYHLGQCLGPCEHEVDEAVYTAMAEDVSRFLNGDTKKITADLRRKMEQASNNLEFEKALEYKQAIDSIDRVIDKQILEKNQRGSRDAFAYFADKGYLAIQGFLVRNGIVLNKEFRLQPLYGDAEEAFISFVMQYYESHPPVNELILPDIADAAELMETLGIPITQPRRGYKKKLLEMCLQNARKQLALKFEIAEKRDSQTEQAVKELSELTGVSLARVDLFDNSHTSGQFTVASCVVYVDGLPSKKDYRLYRLHTGNSDIDSMKEVIYRRYFRVLSDQQVKPDGILVDGGRLQIDAAKEIIDSLGLDIAVFGLVKDDNHNTRALMDAWGKEYDIDKNSALFFLLTRMQDEVHRVAITYHRKLRLKGQTKSILDEVPGIGPKRKKVLLKKFGGFGKLKEASREEIAGVVPSDVADELYRILHSEE